VHEDKLQNQTVTKDQIYKMIAEVDEKLRKLNTCFRADKAKLKMQER
jgi:hypothetical protein